MLDSLVGVTCTLRTAAATSIYDEAEPVRIAPLMFLLMASMNISAFPITAADEMVCLWTLVRPLPTVGRSVGVGLLTYTY